MNGNHEGQNGLEMNENGSSELYPVCMDDVLVLGVVLFFRVS